MVDFKKALTRKKKVRKKAAAVPSKKRARRPKKEQPSWLLRGKAAKDRFRREEKAAEQRRNSLFDFYLKRDEEATVIFLDGEVDRDGLLDIPMFFRHRVKSRSGNGPMYEAIVCNGDREPCPLCEDGNRRQYVGVCTVIDKRKRKGRDGRIYRDQPRLFVATQGTMRILQEYAAKRNGLAGWKVGIKRTDGPRTPNVGDVFDFQAKVRLDRYRDEKGNLPIPDYTTQFTYLTPGELRSLGYGSDAKVIGDSGDDDFDEEMGD